MAEQDTPDGILIDDCNAHLGQHCNCGKLLATLTDPTPTSIADSSPNSRGGLLSALVLGAAVIFLCM